MSTISFQEIQRDPLDFLRRVEAGETILLVQGSQPVAEIKPFPRPMEQPRPFGLCAGEFKVPADFDQPLPEEVFKDFAGR